MCFSLVDLSFNYGVGGVLAKNLEGLRDNYFFPPNNNNSVHLVLRILRAFLMTTGKTIALTRQIYFISIGDPKS